MKHLKTAFNLLMVIPATLGLILMVPFIIIFKLVNTKLVKEASYTDVFAPYYDQLDPYHSPEAWEASKLGVPQAVLDLFALHWLYTEVTAGGFSLFFDNAVGVMAPEARDGFKAIGMDDAAALIQSAMDKVGTPYPRERAPRQDIIAFETARMKFDETARFRTLTGNPHKLGGAPNYFAYADAYAALQRSAAPA